MKERKVRFTIWISPEILRAAKARAIESGMTVSEVLAAAATARLTGADCLAVDERILQAVERVFTLIQRIDRRRNYDHQVIKEMVGLLAQSFFNHIPAVPEKDKKAALYSGKARLNRFLDCLAANLRAGESILNDVPFAELSIEPENRTDSNGRADSRTKIVPARPIEPSHEVPDDKHDPTRPPQNAQRPPARSTLFG